MDDDTEIEVALDPAEAAAEAEAAAAALAGYQARAKAPAITAAAVSEAPAPASGAADADHVAAAPAAAAQPPAVPDLLEPEEEAEAQPSLEAALAQIKELKAAVKSAQSRGSSDELIRKMNGEIGNITRTLQNLGKAPAAKPTPAPADDELAAALKDVDSAADAFPEVGGPLAGAIKALANRTASAQPGMSQEQIAALVQVEAQAMQQKAAVQALAEEHPDFEEVNKSAAFQKWLGAQPEQYRERIKTTWNPAVVSKGLSDFKAELQRQQDERAKKQNRLAAAVTPPRSGAAKAAPSTIPDEEGFNVGYNSRRRLTSATFAKR